MAEYIEREALRKVMQMATDDPTCPMHIAATVDQYITEAPAADVELVRHGRWIDAYPDIEPNPMFMYGICSECGFEQGISKYLKYCPDCGADMRGSNDE